MKISSSLLSLSIALGLLFPACSSETSAHQFDSDVEECKANLRSIFDGLINYQVEKGQLPNESGVRFFAALISSGYWDNSAERARSLICPGVAVEKLALKGDTPENWFSDLSSLTGDSSSYAGRNVVDSPLFNVPGPGTEALIACDNQYGENHDGVTNVLMSDGSILSLELETEIENGNLPEGTTRIVVGPDSALDFLRTLTLD